MGWLVLKRKKKFFILIKFILIVLFAYIFMADGKDVYLGRSYEVLYEVLGKFNLLVIPYLVLSIFSDFIVDKEKRTIFLIRLNFFIIFIIFIQNLELLFYTNDLVDNNELEKKIFKFLFVEKDLGMLLTMIFFKTYFIIPLNVNIAITGIILFISSFILFGKIVGNSIRGIINYYSKENREARKQRKKLLKEEKRVKKQIKEKEKREKIEREKQLQREKIKEELREKRITELKEEIEKKIEIKKETQLILDGIEVASTLTEKDEIKEENKEVEEKIEISEKQLKFSFSEEEVKDDISI